MEQYILRIEKDLAAFADFALYPVCTAAEITILDRAIARHTILLANLRAAGHRGSDSTHQKKPSQVRRP
jgi:hypothetical protein